MKWGTHCGRRLGRGGYRGGRPPEPSRGCCLDLKMLDNPPLEKVLEVAVERDLTFYDASYAYVAETLGLSLVTRDRELLRKSPASIDVDTFLARL